MRTSLYTLSSLIAASVAVPKPAVHYEPLTLTENKLVERSPGRYKDCESGRNCPAYLRDLWIAPSGIIPISQASPDTAFGNVNSPVVTPNDFCTIFNLFIPPSAVNKTCTLEFIFPKIDQLDRSSYYYEGEGHFTFSGYVGYGGFPTTTWNTQPPPGDPKYNPPPQVISPGRNYVLNKPYPGSCLIQEGQPVLEVGGRLCSNDTYFTYYQDSKPCPIGFYIQVSD